LIVDVNCIETKYTITGTLGRKEYLYLALFECKITIWTRLNGFEVTSSDRIVVICTWLLVSISSTFYSRIFHTNVVSAAFSMYMQLEKSCQNNVCAKNLHVKCWWNWLLVGCLVVLKSFHNKMNEVKSLHLL